MLQVKGDKIINELGKPVQLRGTCIGGWMNMENFINGHPGAEHTLRMTMGQVLGTGQASFFFNRLLDYFLSEADIAFIRECGANVVRLPLNYRHFEHDEEPFKYLQVGFERLDQVLSWCAKYGIYAILDLHAVQGWQSNDWHSDNAHRHSLFWQNPHYQARFVALWQALAARYRNNSTVAGYNVMNEPVTGAARAGFTKHYVTDWAIINRVYGQVVEAIRDIDPQHIIFLEGDRYSTCFSGLAAPFAPNLVYSSHNYTLEGFGPGSYPDTTRKDGWSKAKQEQAFLAQEGTQFCLKYKVPLWISEFGAVYNGLEAEIPDRLRAMDDQLAIFEQYGVHWTSWTYKDTGVMGWTWLDPACEYLSLIKPVTTAKQELQTDSWMSWLPHTVVRQHLDGLAQTIQTVIGDLELELKPQQEVLAHLTLDNYAAGLLQNLYAGLFKPLSETEIERVLSSFTLARCQPNTALLKIVRKHLAAD